MISLRNGHQARETRASQARRTDADNATGRTSTKTASTNATPAAKSSPTTPLNSSPFNLAVAAAAANPPAQAATLAPAPSADDTLGFTKLPGTVDLSMFTTVAIDRQASVAYSKAAEAKNYEIDFLYNQARDNWELNGRRGAEPVKPQYHEAQSEKIFHHLQAFRHGEIAIPSDGAGYLSVDGYMTASPHQQRYGAVVEQLTAYSGSGYQQTKMPNNPATPNNADVMWGPATEALKTKA